MLFVLASMIAAPLSATWWPVWSPLSVQLVTGQRTKVQVQAWWSGLVDYGNGIHWSFRTDYPHVATAAIYVSDSAPHDVEIVATGPGYAAIRRENENGSLGQAFVQITVTCGPEPAVRAMAPLLHARAGDAVTLQAYSEIGDRSRFAWYAGRQGDTSHPLAATGPQIVIVPRTVGPNFVWVNATTPCSASTAEFRIDVPARIRAARP